MGAGLTQILVYGKLGELNATPSTFAATFAISVFPSFFSTQLGAWLTRRMEPFLILAAAELLGAVSICIPIFAIRENSEALLMISTFLPAVCSGLGLGAYSLICKQGFHDANFPAVSAIETITFSATVFLGTGLGAVLYPFVSMEIYLAVDIATYLIAAILIISARRPRLLQKSNEALPQVDDETQVPAMAFALRGHKLRAFWLMPLLACITAPAMALLPAIGTRFSDATIAGVVVAPTVLLIFARSIGQLLGPLVLTSTRVTELFNRINTLTALGAMFIFFI